jgi:hypothetical protein
VLALRCGCNDDCSAYNESNDDLIFLESSDDLIFHFAPASQALGLKYRQQFKGQGQLNPVVVKYFLSGPPRSGRGPVRFTLKADIRRTNCHVYEIFILEKPRTKLVPLAVMRTYLIRQAAPPNF